MFVETAVRECFRPIPTTTSMIVIPIPIGLETSLKMSIKMFRLSTLDSFSHVPRCGQQKMCTSETVARKRFVCDKS